MGTNYPKYELLAKALDAQFGNIYEYNVAEGEDPAFDGQEWTDELRTAVRQYLLHDLPGDIRGQLFQLDTDGAAMDIGIEEQVDKLLALEPWEVAFEVRNGAVAAVPTLQELIGHLGAWPSGEESADAIVWLEAHSDMNEWREIARASNHPELRAMMVPVHHGRSPLPDDLVRVLSPKELLAAWDAAVGPASTDLTDAEWRLLAPAFPLQKVRIRNNAAVALRPPSDNELARKRQSLNGIRYKFAHNARWSQVPGRYGKHVYQAWFNYTKSGLFIRLRDALIGKAEAKTLVTWLDQVIARGQNKYKPHQREGAI
ncbi:transposase [Nocardia aurantia]|uniref:Uncharacterized protein n=1 Tax=Nocardia aurantia TaxID=2585199 RepID=A0A7K0DJV9_9NOCA|nr:transposase [Nocardia aurantia]MQY26096.1 hypothetical protein [Nocardia aurantia]